jgi:hypothetical protein
MYSGDKDIRIFLKGYAHVSKTQRAFDPKPKKEEKIDPISGMRPTGFEMIHLDIPGAKSMYLQGAALALLPITVGFKSMVESRAKERLKKKSTPKRKKAKNYKA